MRRAIFMTLFPVYERNALLKTKDNPKHFHLFPAQVRFPKSLYISKYRLSVITLLCKTRQILSICDHRLFIPQAIQEHLFQLWFISGGADKSCM